jgi:hypothetical protein
VKNALLGAALACVLATPAFAGITCNLTDNQGNNLTYSFAKGGHGYTNEVSVTRNGAVISNGGPSWARSVGRLPMTLSQGGWTITYEGDSAHGRIRAWLAHGSSTVATGQCEPDYSIDGGSAPIEATTPTPAPSAPVASNDGPAPGTLSIYLGQ